MKRIHVAAAAALVLLVVPTTSGCFNGQGATTTSQATMNSGNGVEANQGPIQIDGATVVLGPEGSTSGTLTMRIVNTGTEADALTYATINGSPAYVTEGSGDLQPGVPVSFGYDSEAWVNVYDLDVEPSAYIPVELGFANAGLITVSVLTVPAAGYYEGIAPQPPTAP